MRIWKMIILATLLVGCQQQTPQATSSPAAATSATPAVTATAAPDASGTPAAEASKRVFFANLEDGATVKSPVEVKMGVEGMEVKPAGEDAPNSGHHHIIIDGGPLDAGQGVPADEKHIHFGKGQTETTVELTPGEHTLTLQFADYAHRSYGPEMSATIKVMVEE